MWIRSLALILVTSFSLFPADFKEDKAEETRRKCDFKVVDKYCKEFQHVASLFEGFITKWYGPQDKALKKIGDGRDRLCELMFEDDAPVGVIVFKKELQQGQLECKTLCLLDPEGNSGRGLGRLLVSRLVENANRRSAGSIFLTVNSRNSAKNFFLKSGFKIISESKELYGSGETKYSLSYLLSPDRRVEGRRGNSATDFTRDIEQGGNSSNAKAADRGKVSEINTSIDASNIKLEITENTRGRAPSSSTRDYRQGESSRTSRVADIKCTLKKEYVEAIRSGAKTYEGRIASDYFRGYTAGKKVEWYCGAGENERILTEIVSRRSFSSFEDMLRDIDFKKFLPKASSFENACRLYHSVPGYTEKVQRHGALALEVRVLQPPAREDVIVTGSSFIQHNRSNANSGKRKIDEMTCTHAEEKRGRYL
jgi:ASC-1-like (ASCH) protein